MLTIEDIRSNINNGKYDVPDSVFNELSKCKNLHERAEFRRTVINPMGAELIKDFQTDLFEALEISNHPKRERLFDLAWEYGHANGYSEVLIYAGDLADLLK